MTKKRTSSEIAADLTKRAAEYRHRAMIAADPLLTELAKVRRAVVRVHDNACDRDRPEIVALCEGLDELLARALDPADEP